MASLEGRGDHGFVAVPPNHRLQLTGAPAPSSARGLIRDGDQRNVEFGTMGLIARS